jgi:rod shape-determining protein MreD
VRLRPVAVRALLVLAALVLQAVVVTRLPLPGSPPDLVLAVVLGCALAEGPAAGAATGFAAGLLADALADHALGRLALAYVVAGHAVGRLAGGAERSVLRPLLAVGGGAVLALLAYTAEGLLLGDPRVTLAAAGRGLISAVPWTLVLVPLVVPLPGRLLRRDDRSARYGW